jgi:hypothetical protein
MASMSLHSLRVRTRRLTAALVPALLATVHDPAIAQTPASGGLTLREEGRRRSSQLLADIKKEKGSPVGLP